MKIVPISFCGKPEGKWGKLPVFGQAKPLGIWNCNPMMAKDYTNDIKIALTNTIYNGRKGIGEHSPEGFGAVAKLFDIKNFIKLGGESAVFSLNNGNILKISAQKYDKPMSQFHAPELVRGSIQTPEYYKIFSFLKNIYTNVFYYVVQPKGVMPVLPADQEILVENVKKSGYDLCDLKWDQFAYFDINGKKEARFIDLGCIVPQGQGW